MADDKREQVIDERATDSISVTPPEPDAADKEQEQRDLDEELNESMDASDPPASTQPVHKSRD